MNICSLFLLQVFFKTILLSKIFCVLLIFQHYCCYMMSQIKTHLKASGWVAANKSFNSCYQVIIIIIIAFDEGERIRILLLLAGTGLMLSCFENFRTGDRLKIPWLHATVVSCWSASFFSTSSVWLFFGGEWKFFDLF